ncbi:MAG: GNAT family N-acetyltransferase [Paracoccaceae bacterium]|nr:GNAT family N-acetyltransferase [Paracoccaceae bacterium]
MRRAQPTDAGAVAAILSQFIDTTDWMPRLYSRAEELSFAGTMVDRGWVIVAEPADQGSGIAGFMALDAGFIHALYVAQECRGQGVGQRLLDAAKADAARLELNTFQANAGAQRFYARAGFREVGRGDGRGQGSVNDEGLPDIRLIWERDVA